MDAKPVPRTLEIKFWQVLEIILVLVCVWGGAKET
jgi:hypothetical protein